MTAKKLAFFLFELGLGILPPILCKKRMQLPLRSPPKNSKYFLLLVPALLLLLLILFSTPISASVDIQADGQEHQEEPLDSFEIPDNSEEAEYEEKKKLLFWGFVISLCFTSAILVAICALVVVEYYNPKDPVVLATDPLQNLADPKIPPETEDEKLASVYKKFFGKDPDLETCLKEISGGRNQGKSILDRLRCGDQGVAACILGEFTERRAIVDGENVKFLIDTSKIYDLLLSSNGMQDLESAFLSDKPLGELRKLGFIKPEKKAETSLGSLFSEETIDSRFIPGKHLFKSVAKMFPVSKDASTDSKQNKQ